MTGPTSDPDLFSPPPTDAEADAPHASSRVDDQTSPQPNARPASARNVPLTVGHYRIGEELAQGGMGTIYRGWDDVLGRTLAMKVLRHEHRDQDDLRRRFLSEARITSRLQHPCIIPVYDLGHFPDGRPFFTMRIVNGSTLAALLGDRPRPDADWPPLIKVFEKICQGVAYAHTQRVIHRDLKPGNVMVAPFGVVKVMDWGVAKELDGPPDLPPGGKELGASGTEAGRVLGTPAYMAPEQARGEPVDERADVFGLGAILCEILTGLPPYSSADGRKAHRRAARGDLSATYARLAACGAEREVADLACRCLARDPAERPRNADAVALSVTAYLESDQRRAERDLARFFDLSLDLFCLASLDGYFRRVNPNFSRVLGYPEEELVRRPFLDFVHPDDKARTLEVMAVLSRGEPLVRFRNRYRDTRGRYRWFEWTAKSVVEEDIVFAVARDVTDAVDRPEAL